MDGGTNLRTGVRFTVRHRLRDGRATDVVGLVTELDEAVVTLLDRHQVAHRVDRSSIVASRAVAVPRGPDPRSADPGVLEHLAADSWHDQTASLGEWRLRFAGGATSRANSCLAVGDPGTPVPEAAETIMRYAAGHAVPAVAQVIVGSTEEEALRAVGWRQTRTDVAVLVARLVDLCDGPGHAAVSAELPADWFARYRDDHPSAATDDSLRRLLTSGRTVFASRHVEGQLVAIGRASLARDWLTLFGLWTDPRRRRRGLMRDTVASLSWWGAARGARSAQLQVDTESAGALAGYARLGFVEHHRYRYLTPGS